MVSYRDFTGRNISLPVPELHFGKGLSRHYKVNSIIYILLLDALSRKEIIGLMLPRFLIPYLGMYYAQNSRTQVMGEIYKKR